MSIKTWIALTILLPSIASADPIQSIQYFNDGSAVETSTTGHATTITTPFAIASIGKTMTAVAILRLVDRNVIALDAPAAVWLPLDVTSGLGGLEGITIRHLLTMTSGLADYLTDEYVEDALDDPARVQNALTALTYAYRERQVFNVGAGFDYSNTNYVLLGVILEQATGQTYSDVIETEVFLPAGMENSFVFGSSALPANFPNGHEDSQHYRDYYQAQGFGDGGVISTAPDLARFYEALFSNQTLLSNKSLQDLLNDPIGEGYGMGIDIEDGLVGHSGGDLGFASDVRMDIDKGTIAIFFAADADANTEWTFDQLLD
ncbi:MAG: serine hydrolase [Paracoccaceae bacterium]|nr:serine hydrolase [Paracoccaceae bacterium]MDG1739273.1 serine hydrolase [Paracoccaceae bacterium]MDG2258519.1 serine hydrolase [Paracoccaceae bacterium]